MCRIPTDSRGYRSSFIFLQIISVWPVLESIFVVRGMHAQLTVLAFSCLVITQCWMTSADGGGIWLRIGRGAATGAGLGGGGAGGGGVTVACFFAAQPSTQARNSNWPLRHNLRMVSTDHYPGGRRQAGSNPYGEGCD